MTSIGMSVAFYSTIGIELHSESAFSYIARKRRKEREREGEKEKPMTRAMRKFVCVSASLASPVCRHLMITFRVVRSEASDRKFDPTSNAFTLHVRSILALFPLTRHRPRDIKSLTDTHSSTKCTSYVGQIFEFKWKEFSSSQLCLITDSLDEKFASSWMASLSPSPFR